MIKICANCQKEINKKKFDYRSKNHFCSQSCAAQFNNKIPKRKKVLHYCQKCNCVLPHTTQSGYCRKCYDNKTYLNLKTLGEAIKNRKDNNRYTQVRQAARRDYLRSNQPKCCKICGYNTHIEICHIKDIADFSLNTMITEINNMSNLVALCPTHHWEFDHEIIFL